MKNKNISKTKSYGRPAGRIKTSKIEVAIEPEIKDEFMKLLQEEGKKASVEIGIEVRFEKENINSLTGDGELMLSILASFAQEESISISNNIKWVIEKNLKKVYRTVD